MKTTYMIVGAATLALLAGGCTTDSYGPYYGSSQGYAYPGYGYATGPAYGYYSPRPYYYPSYGYASPYSRYGSGPEITFTARLPQGSVP